MLGEMWPPNNNKLYHFLKAVVAFAILIMFFLIYYFYANTYIYKAHAVSTLKPPTSTMSVKDYNLETSLVYYYNTLNVDFLQPQDLKNSSGGVSETKLKLIKAELAWQAEYSMLQKLTRMEDGKKNYEIWERYPPSFNCTSVAKVGQSGKWMCGFELFKVPPRPEECIAYTFGNNEQASSSEFAKEWVTNTECMAFMFQFEAGKNATTVKNNGVHVYPEVDLRSKILRTVLKDNDHAWIDVMLLDIDGEEYKVLEQIMEDFHDEVLPFAQLIVDFHINNNNSNSSSIAKFEKVFGMMVVKGLRPYHMKKLVVQKQDANFSTILEYSFLNLRGRHLLLVGKTGVLI